MSSLGRAFFSVPDIYSIYAIISQSAKISLKWESHLNIIHTSDWHLGQSFINQSRQAEHQQFLDWLLTQVQAHAIDAVIVAGDIFDTTSPPSYAREMYHEFIGQIFKTDCTLVILGGNHDSVAVLNESLPLFKSLNTHMIPNSLSDPADQVVTIPDRKTGAVGAIVCAIPFLRQRDLVVTHTGEGDEDKQARFKHAITDHYEAVYAAAVAKRDALGLSVPIIATGHLTALGAKVSESERDIYVGNLENYPKEAFPPADYIALGHIHRPQAVSTSRHIYYSGSPIYLSFDELSYTKRVIKLSFNEHADSTHPNDQPAFTPQLTSLEIPCFQAMQVLSGSVSEIIADIQSFPLCPPEDKSPMTWVMVKINDPAFQGNVANTINEAAKGRAVVITKIMRERDHSRQSLSSQDQENLDDLTPLDVFAKRIERAPVADHIDANALQQLYRTVVDNVNQGISLHEDLLNKLPDDLAVLVEPVDVSVKPSREIKTTASSKSSPQPAAGKGA